MSAMYSKAFDHMQCPQNENDLDYTYQDPEVDANLSSFKHRGGGGRSTAFRVKQPNIATEAYTHDDMGQDQSSSYIDVFDVNPRKKNPSKEQKSTRESAPVVRRGHKNEESQDYCYAYTHSVSRDESSVRHTSPPTQRTVSLRDDYSHPHDRLSSSGTTQDYIEPYLESQGAGQNPVSPVVPPDPGGIYELAKDVSEIRQSGRLDRSGVVSDHYNHITDVTDTLKHTSVSDPRRFEEGYDHLNSWSNRVGPLTSTDSGNEHYVSAESSPLRKCSNVSDDVFTASAAMNKMVPSVYKDLPANYEEPWDSEEGQKKFDRLMNRAEKKRERESFDQTVQGAGRKSVDHSDTKSATDKKSGDQNASRVDNTGAMDFYEKAWAGEPNQKKTIEKPLPNKKPSVQPKPHHPHLPSNYEDAWDLPEKQKEFEEKLLQARKQRASQGQIRDETVTDENAKTEGRQFSDSSPTLQRTKPDRVMRSDSCRSLGALAEKIDKSVPVEDQVFYHGAIKRSAAERILVVFKEGSYLVRRSETSKKDFSLTLKGWTGQPMHMKIACRPDGTYVLGENSPPFKTIPEMVHYYTTHELPVQNAERICLLYPIPN